MILGGVVIAIGGILMGFARGTAQVIGCLAIIVAGVYVIWREKRRKV